VQFRVHFNLVAVEVERSGAKVGKNPEKEMDRTWDDASTYSHKVMVVSNLIRHGIHVDGRLLPREKGVRSNRSKFISLYKGLEGA
jgi:hypothetical protein